MHPPLRENWQFLVYLRLWFRCWGLKQQEVLFYSSEGYRFKIKISTGWLLRARKKAVCPKLLLGLERVIFMFLWQSMCVPFSDFPLPTQTFISHISRAYSDDSMFA